MAEAGGTTTQSGIYYQNSIASLYLGRLIDSSRTSEETIESVRVEAPEAVDDVLVTYSNGKKEYIQAKERLKSSSEEWKKVWSSFKTQADNCHSKRQNYSLILALSNTDSTIQELKELCERAKGKENTEEWIDSLNTEQIKIVTKITQPSILTNNDDIYNLLKTVEVKIIPFGDIEKDYCPNWIPNSNQSKISLFSHLRDMIGGYARIRRSFTCSHLLEELLRSYGIEIEDSPNWGVSIYKEAIKNEFHILSVPGTELCGGINELFLCPELYENASSDYQDFEFEDLRGWREIKPKSYFELKDFPNNEIYQAVINAGAGLGKTTLLKAISYRLSQDKIKLPAFIPLSTLIESSSVINHLNTIINDSYHVRIDWNYMCLAGRVSIFFDGLDELSNTERQNVLDKISKHIARFPKTDFLLTVRDSSILTKNLDVKILEIRRLSDEKIIEFSKSYSQFGAKIDGNKLLEHTKHNPELMHLLRIPLFLSLVLATFKADTSLPTSRTDILEHYLDILFSPEKHKPNQEESNTPHLRIATEYLAYEGLIKGNIGFHEKDILRYLHDFEYCDNPKEYLENLHKYGILSKVSTRWQFTYPTIQEYLASQYIVENKEDEIINGFEKIILRPWAQTMQFVLESCDNSNKIIKEQIKKDDDVFYTSLRLISRCVVNGAKVDNDTKKEIGNLLSDRWNNDSSAITESIGNLLLDGFINDLPQKAEEHIIRGWALGYSCGGAKILTAKKDKILTKKVLINMLSKDIEHKFSLNNWQEAVDEITEEALELYLERAKNGETKEKEVSALQSLITNLDRSKIVQEKWVEIVNDTKVPTIIRFSIAVKIPEVVEVKLKELYEVIKSEWLEYEGEYYSNSYEFHQSFWLMPECEFLNLIEKCVLSDKQIEDLLDSLFWSKRQNDFVDILLKTYNSKYFSDRIKFKLNILLFIMGIFDEQKYALENLCKANIDNIVFWCFNIGYFNRDVALEGLSILSNRCYDKEEYKQILSSLCTGLNYKVDLNLSGGSLLDKKNSHLAMLEFASWLLKEIDKYKFTNIEYLRVMNNISQISTDPIKINIENILDDIISNWTPLDNNDEYNEEDSNTEYSISTGLRLSEREKIQLSENCLLKIVSLKRHNLVLSALPFIVKIANRDTIDKLIKIHKSMTRSDMKGYVLDALEKISSRLGIRIINVDGNFNVE